MDAQWKEVVGSYMVDCSPQPTQDGRFAARAVLHGVIDGAVVDVRLTPHRDPFRTEKEAAEVALAAARSWIAKNW